MVMVAMAQAVSQAVGQAVAQAVAQAVMQAVAQAVAQAVVMVMVAVARLPHDGAHEYYPFLYGNWSSLWPFDWSALAVHVGRLDGAIVSRRLTLKRWSVSSLPLLGTLNL